MTPILGIMASAMSANLTPTTGFCSIATTTVGAGGSSTITFSSIPQVYRHLQIRWIALNGTSPGYTKINFNSDTGTNYAWHQIYANGATVTGAGSGSKTFAIADESVGGATSTAGVAVADILDYQNTNKNKTVSVLSGRDQNGSGNIVFNSGAWFNTTAITRIDLTFSSSNVAQYSQFALYGIQGA
jgi:hypothetical protein